MKKILYSLMIFASASLFAQKNPTVKFAVANDAVGTVAMFDARKDAVQSVQVFKSSNVPQNLKKYSYIAENGIAEVKFKKSFGTLDRIPLSILNGQIGIATDTPVIIEGYEFKDTATEIFAEMITSTEVKDYNGKKTLFISTTTK